MKLKRYVLLNGYNLILDSKNEKELRVVHYDDGDVLKVVLDEWYYPLEKLDYKTSDNILDLFDVGDLVKVDNELLGIGGEIYEVLEIRGVFLRILTYVIHKSDVQAIYKRQTNGDYKRYEVKE